MIKEPLIKYVMEQADKCYADDFPIHMIEEWIREFFDTYKLEEALHELIAQAHAMGINDTNMDQQESQFAESKVYIT